MLTSCCSYHSPPMAGHKVGIQCPGWHPAAWWGVPCGSNTGSRECLGGPVPPALTFHLLGPLEVRADGVALSVGTRKQQTILALLALHAGRAVQLDELVDEVWPERPPASAVANVRSYCCGSLRACSAHIRRRSSSSAQSTVSADPRRRPVFRWGTRT